MCALKAIVLFYLVVSAILITSSPSNAKRFFASKKKTQSSYVDYLNKLFSDKSVKRKPRHLSFKNDTPTGRMKAQLYCRTGFMLEVLEDGRISGTRNTSSKYTIIEIQIFGHIMRRLKGVASGRYLSVNSRGRFYSTLTSHHMNTFFNERMEENLWCSYSSSLHRAQNCSWKRDSSRREWFIAIKKNGALKRPCKTAPGMHSTQFIIVPKKREAIRVKSHTLGTGI